MARRSSSRNPVITQTQEACRRGHSRKESLGLELVEYGRQSAGTMGKKISSIQSVSEALFTLAGLKFMPASSARAGVSVGIPGFNFIFPPNHTSADGSCCELRLKGWQVGIYSVAAGRPQCYRRKSRSKWRSPLKL